MIKVKWKKKYSREEPLKNFGILLFFKNIFKFSTDFEYKFSLKYISD